MLSHWAKTFHVMDDTGRWMADLSPEQKGGGAVSNDEMRGYVKHAGWLLGKITG